MLKLYLKEKVCVFFLFLGSAMQYIQATSQNFFSWGTCSQKNATANFFLGLNRDHLGNVRLSYKKLENQEITNDTFTGSTDSWYGSGSTLTQQSGKLKVSSTALWSSARKRLERKVREGDQITARIYIDKGTTTAIAVGVSKYENDTYKGIDNIMEFTQGWNTFEYTVPEGVNTLDFKVSKNVNDGVATYYYIDNFKLTLNGLEIIEESAYYPFGMKIKGINNVVTSGGNSVAQKIGFQEQMLDDDLGLNWYGFKYRNYDPSLARFHNIDPLAEDYYYNGTYNFAENKVIQYNELEGLEATMPMIYSKLQQAYTGLKQAVTGAKQTVVNDIKTKTPTSNQKTKVENQQKLSASKDKMISGMVISGLPGAPSEKSIFKGVGLAGDAMVIASPLTGPFAPAVASVGSAVSTLAAVGEAQVDISEGNTNKVATDVAVEVTTEAASRALKLDKVEPVVEVINEARVVLYKEAIVPAVIEKAKEKSNNNPSE